MVTVKQKTITTMKMTAEAKSHCLTEIRSRDVSSLDAKIAEAKRQLNRYCPISKVIRGSGSELEEVWTVQRS